MPKKLTTEEFIAKAIAIHGDKYDYSQTIYINARTKVKITCQKHGYFEQTPNRHLSGDRCPKCNIITTQTFIDRSQQVHGNVYDYSKSKYTHSQSKIEILCPTHGSFFQLPTDHWRGRGCRRCNISVGESEIKTFLDHNNTIYIQEHTFIGCKNKYPLPFDFYIPSINLCIEFDGIQHFEPRDFFGGQKSFEQTQTNDKLKNEYCKTNGINLIRIPYWEFLNIHSILLESTLS